MVYAHFEYYQGEFRGTMSEEGFLRLSRRASVYIDRVTFDRIPLGQPEDIMARVRDACCAIADAYLLNERGGGIASESNDGVSVSYVAGVSTAKTDDERLRNAVTLYLGNTGLLYRGVP